MSRSTRYSGKDWFGSWVTATGTTTLNGDQRVFTWNRNAQYVDNTAGADAATSQKKLRVSPTASLTIAAHSDGTAEWDVQFISGLEGTLIWSTGEGTADGKGKYTCAGQMLDSSTAEDYANMTEWTINWELWAEPSVGVWASGA